MLVGENRDRAAFNNVQATALQRETSLREILDWEGQLSMSIEPYLDNLLIVGDDAGHMSGLQRAQMRFNNFSGKFGLVIVAAKPGTHFPQYDPEEKQSRRCGHPMPKERLGRRSRWRLWANMGVNFPPQRGGGRHIKSSEPQCTTQQIQIHELSGAEVAMLKVTLEFDSSKATELTIEIGLEQRISKITLHGRLPSERSLPVRNTTGAELAIAKT